MKFHAVAQLRQQAGKSRVRLPMMSVEFFFEIFLPVVHVVDSASNRIAYQEYFLKVNVADV